ncbi:uncharacterized protein SCODWIG_01340 [Saccharomycodes ludwigii]|uniref:Biogenesis of lysosome-related organelles complex 1 subunit BLI1 n=1 Tax=Saccharomycodes ludwigii TaxID=36035 RepID=A0A376B4S8_9ASCO|nr:hypothetical protein SCDLUD_004280 [Saccharomycodes ludwigii]KAH3899964.1 hypothetical protein SCDLUD_004280 [Saccharomycodes ludwigii]SSD59579.1 uncharacterized protein SCODWIG_01340 [Saccharomycodes ludwigii]
MDDIDKLINAHVPTKIAKLQWDIERTSDYITNKQLNDVVALHDKDLTSNLLKLDKFINKYDGIFLKHKNFLQKNAELLDKDIRILEMTMDLVQSANDTAYSN